MITANLLPSGEGRTVSYIARLECSAPTQFECGFEMASAGTHAPIGTSARNEVDQIDVVFTGAFEANDGAGCMLVRAGQIAHTPANLPRVAHYREATRKAYALFGREIRNGAQWRPHDPPPAHMQMWPGAVSNAGLRGPLARIEHGAAASLDVLTARLLAGDEIPLEGTAQLPCWDFEIVLSGRVEARIDGEYVVLSGGDAVLIPPGAHQWVRFLENTELLVIFFGHQAPTIDLAELGGIQEDDSK